MFLLIQFVFIYWEYFQSAFRALVWSALSVGIAYLSPLLIQYFLCSWDFFLDVQCVQCDTTY